MPIYMYHIYILSKNIMCMYTQCTYQLKCNLQMDAYHFYYIIPCSYRKQGIKLKQDYKI